jgi:trk system potassium uptake protein TrkA
MHVVVVGCGRVGSELAASLEGLGHTVAVIDKNSDSFRRLGEGFAGQRVVGYGFDRATLTTAGIEKASALAAVTSGDNSNILTARVARENFGIEHVVARIYDPRRAAIFQRLGIPTVATVSWTTDQVMRRLLPAEHHSEWQDATGTVALVELAVPPSLAGTKLAALNSPGKWWLTTVTRLGQARVTTDTLVLQEGDIAHFVVEAAAIPELRTRMAAGKGEHA